VYDIAPMHFEMLLSAPLYPVFATFNNDAS